MIISNKDDFYLFQDILYRNYFNDFQQGKKQIEFLLNNNCEQNYNCIKCNNCIDKELYKNQNIYEPSKTTKIENLKTLIDWYVNNNFYCDIIFNGCVDYEMNILSIFEYLNQVFKTSKNTPKNIYVYTKGENIEILHSIKNIFTNSNIEITFIINVNGKYCDKNSNTINYNNIINFINTNRCIINASITSQNISSWIENYKWWIEVLTFDNIKKLYLNELLDNSWDYEQIQEYLTFLNFQINLYSSFFKEDFKEIIFNKDNIMSFLNIQIIDQEFLTNKKYYQNCLFHTALTIDVSTLKIPMCHKLNYPIYHIGEILINKDEKQENIVFSPINLSGTIAKAHLKKSCTPHCEYCNYLNICPKTCYGENFKVSYNPLCPIKESCNLIKAKYNFLIYKFNLMNLMDFPEENLSPFQKNLLLIKEQIFQNKEEKINDLEQL